MTAPQSSRDGRGMPGMPGDEGVFTFCEAHWSSLRPEDRSILGRLDVESVEYVPHPLFGKADAEEVLFGGRGLLKPGATAFETSEAGDGLLGRTTAGKALTSAQEILL